MELNKTYHGDCLEVMKEFPDGSVDLICCDLPYGISKSSGYVNNAPDKKDYIAKYGKHKIDFGEWDTKELDLDILSLEYYRLLRKGGVVVIFYDIWGATDVRESFEKFKQPRILEWVKTNPVPINSKVNFLSNAKEYIFTFVKKGSPTFNSKYNVGSFSYPICHGNERTKHPTQKPLSLIEDIIKIYSNEGDVVLDNCAGSGTTGVACVNTNRKYVMIEKEEKYIDIINKRMEDYPGLF